MGQAGLVGDHDFYPRPPRGGRPGAIFCSVHRFTFLSTPSARRATCFTAAYNAQPTNFYPRPPRGGRPVWLAAADSHGAISIHALREEGDKTR